MRSFMRIARVAYGPLWTSSRTATSKSTPTQTLPTHKRSRSVKRVVPRHTQPARAEPLQGRASSDVRALLGSLTTHAKKAGSSSTTTMPSSAFAASPRQQGSTKASRPRRHKPHIDTLPGGALLEAVVPSPLALLQAQTVAGDVAHFIATQTENSSHESGAAVRCKGGSAAASLPITVFAVPHTNLKRAVLSFSPSPGSAPVHAIGQATKEKVARKLCLLHAAALIDYFTVHPPLRRADSARGQAHDNVAVAVPLPPPLTAEPVVGNARHASTNTSPTRALTTLPQPGQYESWEAYTRAAAAYIARQSEAARLHTLLRGKIPRSGNPFVDRATARLEQRTKSLPKLLMQRLNNEIRDASREMSVTPLGREYCVASLVLEARSGLVATGVGRSSKIAKQRCAGHALYILQELQKAARSTTADAVHTAGAGQDSVRATLSAPLPSLVESLKPHQSRLFGFYQRLVLDSRHGDTPGFSTRFTKCGDDDFVCTATLGDVSCDGRGMNRFEAERKALEAVLTEMELYDARVQAIGSFLAQYPRAEAQSLLSVALPPPLRAQMSTLLPQFEAALQEGEKTTLTTPTRKPEVPSATVKEKGAGDDVFEEEEDDASPEASSVAPHIFNEEEEEAGKAAKRNTASTASTEVGLDHRERDRAYAAHLREQLCRLRASPTYLSRFHTRRTTLAVATVRDTLLTALASHRVVLVCGTTGCGKTTQIPQYILDDAVMRGCGDKCRIIVTQPRRLTTFGVADRIAKERLEEVGQNVGYAMRLDAKPGRHITLCTSGVLLQMLVSSPNLDQCSHLILDEVHERDINCDVSLALVKTLLQTNPHLKVILMSATMQHELFVNYFRTCDATGAVGAGQGSKDGTIPVIHVEGSVYPVKTFFLDDIADACLDGSGTASSTTAASASLSPFKSRMFDALRNQSTHASSRWGSRRTPVAIDYRLIAHLIFCSVTHDMRGDPTGKSILVFLPGWKELLAAKRAIEDDAQQQQNARDGGVRPHIILLHSTIDSAKQKACFLPAPPGMVKVVLATNIAESGITIDDVAVVIDTGLLKLTSWTAVRGGGSVSGRGEGGDGFDVATSASPSSPTSFGTQLSLGYASRANCTQRTGRAGRTQGGVCYRLFPRATFDAMPAFQTAEIHRVSLAQVLLKLLSLGHVNPRDTLKQFIEAPSTHNVEASIALLRGLGAVDGEERLTALGRYLARLPCDPRVGKMIVMGAVLRCLDSVLTVAAAADATPFISSRTVATEVRQQRFLFANGSQSDHVSALNAYNAYCQQQQQQTEEGASRYGAHDAVSDYTAAHYLNMSNLRLISAYKLQYRDILAQAGLLSSVATTADDLHESDSCEARQSPRRRSWRPGDGFVEDSPLSADARDLQVVKACVCAALFPNVAVLDVAQQATRTGGAAAAAKAKKLMLRTKSHPSIAPSKDSVCRSAGLPRADGLQSKDEFVHQLLPTAPIGHSASSGDHNAEKTVTSMLSGKAVVPSTLYVFQDIFTVREARQHFLTNVTSISVWSLLLFGAGEANMTYVDGVGICAVDGWLFVEMSREDFTLVQKLKQLLFMCVWRLYAHPHDQEAITMLSSLRALSRAVLAAPLAGVQADEGGVILSPFGQFDPEPCQGMASDHDDESPPVATPSNTVNETHDDEDEEEDVFGIFIDGEDDDENK